MKKGFFLFFILSKCIFVFAQGEFIIEIDPATGSYIQPNTSINGVTWVAGYVSTYDEIHGLYIFPSSGPNELISVNPSDSIFFNPTLSSLDEFQYDNSSGILYGLQNPSAGQFIFCSVNPSTASYTQIGAGPISGMNGIYQGMSTFDKNNHRYIIYVSGNILFSIDALSGNVLSSPAPILNSGESLVHICFDDSTNGLYGLLQNSIQTFLVLINTSTGSVTKIGSGTTYGFGGGTAAIDKMNRRYIYDYSLNGSFYVAVMDIPTGNIIYNNVVPFASGGNINSIEYDNLRKKLYAEHWDASTTTAIKQLNKPDSGIFYPNPAGNTIIMLSGGAHPEINIYNSLGEIVLEIKSNNMQAQIDVSKLAAGIYIVQAQGKFTKLIKE